jgi:hypothetical protein
MSQKKKKKKKKICSISKLVMTNVYRKKKILALVVYSVIYFASRNTTFRIKRCNNEKIRHFINAAAFHSSKHLEGT